MKAEGGRSPGRAPEGHPSEAFHKDLDLVRCIRQTYFRAHMLVFHKKVTHDLANIFWRWQKWQASWALNPPSSGSVVGQKELHMANHAAKGSAKNLHYFWVVSPIKSPKIMGLKGIHSPDARKCQTGLSFCPWCRKEGQNEGAMVNHLCTGHYCLGLVCKRCLHHFTISSDRMQHHLQGCQSTHVCDDEESD